MIKSVLAAALFWTSSIPFESAWSQTRDVLRGVDSMKRRPADPTLSPPGAHAEGAVQEPKASPWRSLKPGMTEAEVTNALGEPDRVESQAQTIRWYWDKGEKGWVSFGNESRKVIEWRNL